MRSTLFFVCLFLVCASWLQGQSMRLREAVEQAATSRDALPVQPFRVLPKPAARANEQRPTDAVYLEIQSAALEVLTVASPAYVEMALPTESGVALKLQLVPSWPYAESFDVACSNGEVGMYDLGTHYQGVVEGDAESVVAISIFGEEMMGVIATNGQHYNLGKIENDTENTHILYSEDAFEIPKSFACATDDAVHAFEAEPSEGSTERASNPVDVHMETDFSIFQNKGSVQNVVNYMGGLMNQVKALYANETITLAMSYLHVWNTVDPYTGPASSDYLTQFRSQKNGVFTGDIAQLVTLSNSLGGIAYVNVICYKPYAVGFAAIQANYSNVPTYSWSVNAIAHELGHTLGSKHTHACVWNGNNTPIDGCGAVAGYNEGCNGPIPASGTIMSYCHLVNGVGVNFTNGFGSQPGNVIRTQVAAATCLASPGAPPPTNPGTGAFNCTQSQVNLNSFETNLGIWQDGGVDCERRQGTAQATDGQWSIMLRDKTNASIFSTGNLNLTNYQEVKLHFGYYAESFETGEDFWVLFSTNGGVTWTTIADYNAGTEFSNGQKKNVTITLRQAFTATTRFRFRCDASDDDDMVFIDNVRITGCKKTVKPPAQPIDFEAAELVTQLSSSIKLSPNPAQKQAYAEAYCSGGHYSLRIFDVQGGLRSDKQFFIEAGRWQEELDLEGLEPGIYVVSWRGVEGNRTGKLVVR